MKMIQARNYNGDRTETRDYKKVHDFLVKSNCVDYTYGRFDRNSHLALIEPVCVVPKQRKLELIPFRTGTIWKRKQRYVLGL